jgi:hypothetical protein
MADNVRDLRPARVPWDAASHVAAPGARFVTPHEYLDGIPDDISRSMVKRIVVEALAAAADKDGVILNFSLPEFFQNHIAGVLNQEDEEPKPLVYDRFTATTLIECMSTPLLDDGLVAHRGNGDSVDYRLTLPR